MSAGDEAAPFDRLVDTAAMQMTDLTGLPNLPLIDALGCSVADLLSERDDADVSPACRGEWLLLAASLALLRATLVSPTNRREAEAGRREADALRQQGIVRVQVRAAADWLEQQMMVRQTAHALGPPDVRMAGNDYDLTALFRGCLAMLQLPARYESIYAAAFAVSVRLADEDASLPW